MALPGLAVALAVGGVAQAVAGASDQAGSASGGTRCATAKTQLLMDRCATSTLAAAERRLAAALRAERARYGATAVRAAQTRWLSFRSAECRLEASPDKGGSIYPLVYATCELTLTRARIAQVRQVTHAHR